MAQMGEAGTLLWPGLEDVDSGEKGKGSSDGPVRGGQWIQGWSVQSVEGKQKW